MQPAEIQNSEYFLNRPRKREIFAKYHSFIRHLYIKLQYSLRYFSSCQSKNVRVKYIKVSRPEFETTTKLTPSRRRWDGPKSTRRTTKIDENKRKQGK